jgi:putative sigma-54 modulation protein
MRSPSLGPRARLKRTQTATEEDAMRLRVKGKNIEVNGSTREYAESKLGKLEKYLVGDPEVEVELSEERNPSIQEHFVADATVFLKGSTLRASESAIDMRIAIDRLHENLERQVRRYREKRRVEPRRHSEHRNTE